MKKILIAHIPNTLNYGSAMMAINLIYGLRERLGQDVEIFCDCDDYHLQRLKEATNDLNLKSYVVTKTPNKSKIKKGLDLLMGNTPLVREVSSRFQMMIVLGGDDLSETYMIGALLYGLQYSQINRTCSVILAGQSLGPFTGVYKWLARWLFNGLTIFTRDDNSYEFCTINLNFPKIHQSRDLAIHSLPMQDKWNQINCTLPLEKDGYVVVVPSGLVKEYTSDRNGYLDTWVTLISQILARNNVKKVVILAHVLFPIGSSDIPVIEDLMLKMPDENKDRLIVFKNPIQPAEARALLGDARYVVTGRMHAAVSTFFMGKPALSLAYSEKYMGVIGRGLNLSELIIDCRNQKWGSNSEILHETDISLNYIEANYSDLCEKISVKIAECQIMVENQIDRIANIAKTLHE